MVNSYGDQPAKHPAWGYRAFGVFPRNHLKFHKGVLVSVELALRVSSIANCIPIAERQTEHGAVARSGAGRRSGIRQLRAELNQVRKTKYLQ